MNCPHRKENHEGMKNLLRIPRNTFEKSHLFSKKYLCFKCGRQFLKVLGLRFGYSN
jgi:hypothetical protein